MGAAISRSWPGILKHVELSKGVRNRPFFPLPTNRSKELANDTTTNHRTYNSAANRHNHHAVCSDYRLDHRRRKDKEPAMSSRKSLDLTTPGIEDLFLALEKLPNQSPITAIEAMLGWGYTDKELWILCGNRCILYSEYIEATFNFLTNPQTTRRLR
jgi:hypothetical protein